MVTRRASADGTRQRKESFPQAPFEWLDKAVAARDVHLIFLTMDSKWDEYRSDPRFETILVRCGFRAAIENAPID